MDESRVAESHAQEARDHYFWGRGSLPGTMHKEPEQPKVQSISGGGCWIPVSFWGIICLLAATITGILAVIKISDLLELGKMLF